VAADAGRVALIAARASSLVAHDLSNLDAIGQADPASLHHAGRRSGNEECACQARHIDTRTRSRRSRKIVAIGTPAVGEWQVGE
jgi:hypothetical protein